jgi:hypothetical protein
LIEKEDKEIRMLKEQNRRLRVELIKDGNFLIEVEGRIDHGKFVQRFIRETEINLVKIKGYREKLLEMEHKLEEKSYEEEEIEIVNDLLY